MWYEYIGFKMCTKPLRKKKKGPSFSCSSTYLRRSALDRLCLPSHSPRLLFPSAMAQPAFLSSLRSRLGSAPPPPPNHRLQPRRGYHVELGAREKAVSASPNSRRLLLDSVLGIARPCGDSRSDSWVCGVRSRL